MWPVLLLCAFLLAPISGEYCHPGQEGQPYELFYRSPDYLDLTKSDLIWSVKYDNGTSLEVAHCYEDLSCSYPTSEFTAWKNKVDNHYLPSFEIESISPEHRDMEVILESSDPYFDTRSTLFSCRLPTYTEPIAPVCSAREISSNTIEVECTAKQVYPDAQCELFQVKDHSMTSVIIPSKPHYRQNAFVNDAYYKEVTCSTTVFVPHSGSYRYYVEMIPRLPGLDSSDTAPVKSNLSNLIVITHSKVDVKMVGPKQPVDVCPGQALSIDVKCEAYGFTHRPTFEWKLNEKSVLPSDDVEVISSLNGPVFSQSHDIKSEKDFYNIQCLVHLGQKEELRASDTLQVTFRRLAYVDISFTHVGGLIEDGAHKHLQRDDSLLCKMDKPTQDARGVEIKCHRDGRLVIRKRSEGNRVRAFMASEDPGTIDCECKVRLSDAKCRQRPHHAKITLLDEQHQESTGRRPIYLMPLIVMTVFIVLTTIAIVYCMCWNRVRRCRLTRGNNKIPERASEEEEGEVEEWCEK